MNFFLTTTAIMPSQNINLSFYITLYTFQRKHFPHIRDKVPVNMEPELSLITIWETNDS